MKNSRVLILAIAFISVSLLGFTTLASLSSFVDSRDISKSFSSLGEQIYFSGRGEGGRRIPYQYGLYWLRMHGGNYSSCHGDDEKGGLQIMMSDERPPAITWEALTQEERDDEDEKEHPPYDKRTIERAITGGAESGRQES